MTVVTFSLEVVTIVIVPLFIINYKNAHSYNLLQTGYVCKNSITRPIHPHYAFYEGIHP